MSTIYECPCCGSHHLAEYWRGHSVCYCPSCRQPSRREALDYLSDLINYGFWPSDRLETSLLELVPNWGKR